MDGTHVNLFLAFAAGLLSFISPCTLPIYPGFLSYITGVSVAELKQDNGMLQRRAILHTVCFLIGFSIIFIVLGFSTSVIGHFFYQYRDLLRQIGAILILFFGLVIVGLIQPKFLMKDKKVTFRNRPSGYVGSALIGLGFAAGWTPCMGPILVVVLGLSLSDPGPKIPYMIAYVLGFAVPFFVLSFFLGKLGWIKRHNRKIMQVGGYLMIVMSVFLFFNWMTKFSSYLSSLFGGFQGF